MAWIHPDPVVRAENRATLNTPLHQTANAIAKNAFLQHLDTLKKGDQVLVTVGGCGAGKGYAMGKDKDTGEPFVPEAFNLKKQVKAVWDSAGDQNATENPWIQKELEKRGLKGNYVFVHADPKVQWADEDNKNNPNANFVFLDGTTKPTPSRVDSIPREDLHIDRKELAEFAADVVRKSGAPGYIVRGALRGEKYWKD